MMSYMKHICMMSYRIACADDIICLVYDISYDSGLVQMQPDLNQMQALLVPYVCLSQDVLASKSGCRCLLLYIRYLGECTRIPPSPSLPHPHRSLRHAPPG